MNTIRGVDPFDDPQILKLQARHMTRSNYYTAILFLQFFMTRRNTLPADYRSHKNSSSQIDVFQNMGIGPR